MEAVYLTIEGGVKILAKTNRRVIIRSIPKEGKDSGFYWLAAFPDEAAIMPGKRRASAKIPCIPFEICGGKVTAQMREELNLSCFASTQAVTKAALDSYGVYPAVKTWLEDDHTRIVFRQYTKKNKLGVVLG